MKLAVIADDFTGANDTGVQFAKKGMETVVTTSIEALPESLLDKDVVAFDTESRFDTAQVAHKKVKDLAELLKKLQGVSLYKKIDSTFRGNIGAELKGCMDGFSCNRLIFIPALPSHGRTTVDGYVFVHGEKLHTTEIAQDPRTPVKSSYIPDIIAAQTDMPVFSISPKDGVYSLRDVQCAIAVTDEAPRIILFNAATLEDFRHLADILRHVETRYILAGTAGFAEFVPFLYPLEQTKPLLVVCGSVSVVSRRQITYAIEQDNLQVFDITVEHVNSLPARKALAVQVVKAITQGEHVALCAARDRSLLAPLFADSLGCVSANEAISEKIAWELGEITELVLVEAQHLIGGLFVTGGDTLIKIAHTIQADGMSIRDEVLPGMPLGYFLHEQYGHISVITKAGGFGEESALHDVIGAMANFPCKP